MVLKCLKIQLIIQVFLKLCRSIVLLFKVFIPDDRSHTHTNRQCQCNVKGVKYLANDIDILSDLRGENHGVRYCDQVPCLAI